MKLTSTDIIEALEFLNLYICLQILDHFKFQMTKVQPECPSVYQLDEKNSREFIKGIRN